MSSRIFRLERRLFQRHRKPTTRILRRESTRPIHDQRGTHPDICQHIHRPPRIIRLHPCIHIKGQLQKGNRLPGHHTLFYLPSNLSRAMHLELPRTTTLLGPTRNFRSLRHTFSKARPWPRQPLYSPVVIDSQLWPSHLYHLTPSIQKTGAVLLRVPPKPRIQLLYQQHPLALQATTPPWRKMRSRRYCSCRARRTLIRVPDQNLSAHPCGTGSPRPRSEWASAAVDMVMITIRATVMPHTEVTGHMATALPRSTGSPAKPMSIGTSTRWVTRIAAVVMMLGSSSDIKAMGYLIDRNLSSRFHLFF